MRAGAAFLVVLALSCSSPERLPVEIRRSELPVLESRPALPVPVQRAPREIVLLPGDLLDIKVYQNPDLDLVARIPETGSISFPLIESVEATGRTPSSLEQLLREKLGRDYLRDPQVSVTVREFAQRKVYAMGGIKNPGSYTLAPNERITVLQLVSSAGGLSDKADLKVSVRIVRWKTKSEREVIRLSLSQVEKAVAEGSPEADVELWPGDLVVFPSGRRSVYVLGQVKSPGPFDVPADGRITASMVVSLAGSFTKWAATSKILVLRQSSGGETLKIPFDLDAVMNGRRDLDVELLPGDVVWVPERGLF